MSGIGSSAGTAPSALAISVGGPPSTRIFKPFMSSSVFTCFFAVIKKLGDVVCSTNGWIGPYSFWIDGYFSYSLQITSLPCYAVLLGRNGSDTTSDSGVCSGQ